MLKHKLLPGIIGVILLSFNIIIFFWKRRVLVDLRTDISEVMKMIHEIGLLVLVVKHVTPSCFREKKIPISDIAVNDHTGELKPSCIMV